jgi:DNA-binding CsgD family transcriptional regulator
MVRVLLPHLRRAILTYRRLAQARLEEHTVLAALDRLPWGILLVDAAARPLFVNVEGHRLTGRRDGVWLEQGTLTARRSTDRARLLALIARAATPGGGGGSMAISRPALRPLGIDVVPLILGEASGSSRLVAVFIADPDQQHESDERILARFYGLTAAEAALAARLAAGDSLDKAAERRQVGKETARTHLKQIFRKTGTRRQAELVLCLHRGPLRVARGRNELELDALR